MRAFAVVVAILTIVPLTGCVSDQAHRYYCEKRFPPRPVEDVQVLTAAPDRPHEVIADFQARGASVKYMRKKAAEIGADAVIVGIFGGYRAISDEWASEDKQAKTYSRITGTAIKYTKGTQP